MNRRNFLGAGLVGLILGFLGRKAEAKTSIFDGCKVSEKQLPVLLKPKEHCWWLVPFQLGNYEGQTFKVMLYDEISDNGLPAYRDIIRLLSLAIKHKGPLSISICDEGERLGPLAWFKHWEDADIIMMLNKDTNSFTLIRNKFGDTDPTIHRLKCD